MDEISLDFFNAFDVMEKQKSSYRLIHLSQFIKIKLN